MNEKIGWHKKKDSIPERYIDDFQVEQQAYSDLSRLSCEIAELCKPIARIGDGNCGYIIKAVIDALRDAGMYADPVQNNQCNARKPIPRSVQKTVMERDKYRCKHCGSHIGLEIDHVIARFNGGSDDIDNLQVLCKSCNLSKGVK